MPQVYTTQLKVVSWKAKAVVAVPKASLNKGTYAEPVGVFHFKAQLAPLAGLLLRVQPHMTV